MVSIRMNADPFQSASRYAGDSLKLAKAYLRGQFDAGEMAPCPCCAQPVKLYARTIHSRMVRALSFIAANPGVASRAVVRHLGQGGGGDHAKLIHWGLLRQDAGGKWYATDAGREFLDGKRRVPRHVYLYNSRLLDVSAETISVRDCIDFSLDVVLAQVPAETKRAA